MTGTEYPDQAFLAREHARLALAGAAAVAAFRYTRPPVPAAGRSRVIAAPRVAITVLAALRRLTIHLVTAETSTRLRTIESRPLTDPDLGFQRSFLNGPVRRPHLIEITTTTFRPLATGVAFYFRRVYVPPVTAV